MKVKALIFSAALLASATCAFAQESNRDANGKIQYGPYETNKFFDNWFIGVGGGVNIALDNVNDDLTNGTGLATDVFVGKWIEPCWGIRAGWQGLKNSFDNSDSFKYNYFHGDLLWNVSNQFWGYKEKRVYNLVPYLTAGLVSTDAGKGFAAGAGLLNTFRLGNRVSLFVDARAIALNASDLYDSSVGGAAGNVSVTGGLTFNLGKTNWTRKATTVSGYESALAAAAAASAAAVAAKNAATKEAEALAAENASLKDENEDLKKQLAHAQEHAGNILKEPAYVYFQIGKAVPSVLEEAHLASIANQILSSCESTKFTISGNADSKTGSAKRNMQLSQKRADYVADVLVNQYGVNAERLTVVANGGNDLFENPQLNRATIIEKN